MLGLTVATLDVIALTERFLGDAGTLPPAELRALDAVRLAGAKMVGPRLEAVVAYDGRMYDAARAAGLPVARLGAPQ